MTKTDDITECAKCGNAVESDYDVVQDRQPCQNCGSIIRKYKVTISEDINMRDGYGIKGKRPGKRKPFIEEVSTPDYSYSKEKNVHKHRIIDRDNDKYFEKITDYQSKEIIHYCEEPLSQHFGHGSAKFKK